MSAPHDIIVAKDLVRWWRSPPRSGARLIIAPWEYRHLRAWARVRLFSGLIAAGLGVVTLAFGGDDWKTHGWALAFLAVAAAHWTWAAWELRIARSTTART